MLIEVEKTAKIIRATMQYDKEPFHLYNEKDSTSMCFFLTDNCTLYFTSNIIILAVLKIGSIASTDN